MNALISNPADCEVRSVFHDAEKSGRPSVITDALKKKLNRIIPENRHFTISEVYEQCPEVSRTVEYEIVTEHLRIQPAQLFHFS